MLSQSDDIKDTPEMKNAPAMVKILRTFFRFIFFNFAKWDVSGLENVPLQGPVILVSNHKSWWDPLSIGTSLHRRVHYMAKTELFKMPIVRWVVKGLEAYPVDRSGSGRQAIKASMKMLENGKIIGLFPEGTRSKTEQLGDAKLGAIMIAAKTGAPIIPVGLYNTQNVFKNGWFHPFALTYGKPIVLEISPGEKLDLKKLEPYAEQVMNEISKLIAQGEERILARGKS